MAGLDVDTRDLPITVLSVPAGHPYTRAVHPQAEDITVLPDPVLDPEQPELWWPHPGLEPRNIGPNVDVMHIHFGFEHLTLDATRRLVVRLFTGNIPLVLTVHDLDNPHLEDQRRYHEQLGILIRAAAKIFTLTEDAAREVFKRYGARAAVVPHPAIVPGSRRAATAFQGPSRGAGVFLKSVRSNVIRDPEFYLRLHQLLGDELRVFAHEDAPAELLRALEPVHPAVHAPMRDADLYDAVASCTTCLLPYRRGTHSGWMEMCRDLGTTVVVPDCGSYFDQADTPTAVARYTTGDAASAALALQFMLRRGHVQYRGDRRAQLQQIRELHEHTYRALAAHHRTAHGAIR